MTKSGWTLWGVALGIWGFYCCWHFGYQAGYADGHQTAWNMYQPFSPVNQLLAAQEEAARKPELREAEKLIER